MSEANEQSIEKMGKLMCVVEILGNSQVTSKAILNHETYRFQR